jgi:hypothetical protein
MTERAIQNLEYWIKFNNLPAYFPILGHNSDTSVPFLREGGGEVHRIIDHIQRSLRSMVIFPPGHGASTMLREIVRRFRSRDIRTYEIYVIVDTSKYSDHDKPSVALQEDIAFEILRQLALDGWANAFGGSDRLLQLCGLFDLPDGDGLIDLGYNLKMGEGFANKQLRLCSERWGGDLPLLYTTLYDKIGFDVTVCYDFPHSAEEDWVTEFFGVIKWFHRRDSEFPLPALRETFFLSLAQAASARSKWTVDFQELVIEPYTHAEVAKIFDHHFRPSIGTREYNLPDVMSYLYVRKACSPSVSPLVEMSKRLKDALLADLDIPRTNVEAKLAPKAEMKDL